ncbi:hypothetical protein ACQPZF_03925 [Actinosynnema sp. CS-041913]|uniref:hypothetical protein n=1 Tax=Actinosynnema sp. CS-041913 TaxID=3239917 RepID=UPI003D8D1E25
MFKPRAEMQSWVGIQEETKIEWTVHPHEIVIAIGNLPEFEIVGTPAALRHLLAKSTEALQEFENAQAGQ